MTKVQWYKEYVVYADKCYNLLFGALILIIFTYFFKLTWANILFHIFNYPLALKIEFEKCEVQGGLLNQGGHST